MELINKDNDYLYYIKEIDNEKKYKLILFDLDGTLIKTKSKKKYPEDENDWEFFNDNVINIIKERYNTDNHLLFVLSNQYHLLKKEKKYNDFVKKIKNIDSIFRGENIFFNYIIAVEDDFYRKPLTGMFKVIIDKVKKRDLKNSFFCGDAAGRSGDHAASDMYLAHNINLPFFVPEHIFNNEPMPVLNLPERPFLQCSPSPLPQLKIDKLFLLIIMGPPASGKSYLSKLMNEKYGGVILESDKIKSKEKIIEKAIVKLNNFNSVIIDATLPKKEDRENIIQSIQQKVQNEFRTYCIEMTTSRDLINQLNNFRCEYSENKIKKIPEIAYRVYYKYYQKPVLNEGFQYIFEYNPCIQFSNKIMQKVFNFYY